MERIVFLDRASLAAHLRRPAFEHEWVDYPNTAEHEVVERLRGATIAVSNKVPLRAATLAQLPALRFIAVAATGTNNVELDYCRRRGIVVSNVRHYAVHAVPEHVFMLVLALRRALFAYREDVKRGLWQRAEQFCLMHWPIHDLAGATLGIVGYGAIGQAVGRLGEAFGMRVLIAERRGERRLRAGRTAFETVLEESDVLTLHCPLGPDTQNLIGAAELARMKPGAILINTARGGLVDEQALAEALRQGRLAGAGVDVLSEEPPRSGNPLLALDLPNLIVTPHNAWASREAQQRLADQLVENIEAFVRGEPRNLVR
jgi:glycerate dehydrogenase